MSNLFDDFDLDIQKSGGDLIDALGGPGLCDGGGPGGGWSFSCVSCLAVTCGCQPPLPPTLGLDCSPQDRSIRPYCPTVQRNINYY